MSCWKHIIIGEENPRSATGEPHSQPSQQDQSREVSWLANGERREVESCKKEGPGRQTGTSACFPTPDSVFLASLIHLAEERRSQSSRGEKAEEVAEGPCLWRTFPRTGSWWSQQSKSWGGLLERWFHVVNKITSNAMHESSSDIAWEECIHLGWTFQIFHAYIIFSCLVSSYHSIVDQYQNVTEGKYNFPYRKNFHSRYHAIPSYNLPS